MLRKLDQPQLLDVLDRILDKGIVIDAWMRLSLAGIDFLTVEARIVVASIETYVRHAPALRLMPPQSPPRGTLEIVRPTGTAPARARSRQKAPVFEMPGS